MKNKENLFRRFTELPIEYGAYKANIIPAEKIETDRAFRDMCALNSCGVYGKCWMCPPDVGDIDVLMNEVGKYQFALVYQIVSELEDSYDFEGMVKAKKQFYKLVKNVREHLDVSELTEVLYLGAGGCGMCSSCAKRDGEPCRFPKLATPSLEAYGINVSQLAKAADMKYISGQDTVTYFGAVLFSLDGEEI